MRSIFPPPRRLSGDRVSLNSVVAALGGAAVVIPAKREGAADQRPVAPDRAVASHLVVAPTQRPLCLLVALLHPVPQPIQPHDLGQISRRQGISFLRPC